MNKLAVILVSGIILLSFSFCCAKKDKIKDPNQISHPFKVVEATSNTWVGGQPGVKGIKINVAIDNPEIQLDSVYFRNMKSKMKKDNNSSTNLFVGFFTFPNTKRDYILHENAKEEYGNKAPDVTLKIPYELKKNEAMISYTYNGTTQFYKIEKVEEVKSNVKY